MSDLDHAPERQTLPEGFSPLAKLGIGIVAVASLAYFLVSWRVLHSPLTEAIGETAGSLAVVLLIVSVIGTARAHD
ncbi:hypothetical protein [Dactylosporangium sp. NPDC048998]|uniref:hypothetical protein n=1 Tax=Dactylosporangium sp. NPDC048998 TaxID=3363976 RepID=UPI00371AF772